ncbi:MAG: NAD(+)/NADH kinase [Elusimicrobiota bacterium]
MIIGIIANMKKQQIRAFIPELLTWMKANRCRYVLPYTSGTNKRIDIALTLGGDGMVLKTARMLAGKNIPILPVHMGTLGFLASVKKTQVFDVLGDVLKKKISVTKISMLNVKVTRGKRVVKQYVALNDAVVRVGDVARAVVVEVRIGGEKYINFTGDGVIISSPVGSSAYALAAGGPVVSPSAKVLLLTPLAAHKLTARPVVVEDAEYIESIVLDDAGNTSLTIDGQESIKLRNNDVVRVEKSKKTVTFLRSVNTFLETLRSKFG